MTSPKIILFVTADDHRPGGQALGELEREANEVLGILRRFEEESAGRWRVVAIPAVTLDQIHDEFRQARGRVTVFHYSGHADGTRLLLDDGRRSGVEAKAGSLATFLAEQSGLKLVVLNACSTAPQVQALLDAGVLAVVAHEGPLHDERARVFARAFYASLTTQGGVSVERAFREACARAGTLVPVLDQHRQLIAAGDDGPASGFRLATRTGAHEIRGEGLWTWAQQWLLGMPPLPQGELPFPPYCGLRWLGEEHAELFFGRDREIRELYERIVQPQEDGSPLVLVPGKAGVGKSSLLAAGLAPRLRAGGLDTSYLRRDPQAGLEATLRGALSTSVEPRALPEMWLDAEARSGRPLVLILDQLEEALLRPRDALELVRFYDQLERLLGRAAHRPRGKLLLGFRDEWLPEVIRELDRRHLGARSVYPVAALDGDAVAQVVVGLQSTERLRARYRLSVAPTAAGQPLAEAVAADLPRDAQSASAVAPLLQLLLTRMWSEAYAGDPSAPRFDEPLYLKSRRQSLGALLEGQLAELALAGFEAEVQSGLALDLIHAHSSPFGAVSLSAAEREARYAGRGERMDGLVEGCRARYLLSDGPGTGSSRLAHDALAPAVELAFATSQAPGQVARRILELRTRDRGAEPPVLDDDDLGRVERGAAGMRAWSEAESALVERSRAARSERRAAEELAALNRRRVGELRRWLALAALVLVLGGTIASALWAIDAGEREAKAERERKRAHARFLASEATQMLRAGGRTESAALRALYAVQEDWNAESDAALRETIAKLPVLSWTTTAAEYLEALELSHDGDRLLAAGSRKVMSWDLTASTARPLDQVARTSTASAVQPLLRFQEWGTPRRYAVLEQENELALLSVCEWRPGGPCAVARLEDRVLDLSFGYGDELLVLGRRRIWRVVHGAELQVEELAGSDPGALVCVAASFNDHGRFVRLCGAEQREESPAWYRAYDTGTVGRQDLRHGELRPASIKGLTPDMPVLATAARLDRSSDVLAVEYAAWRGPDLGRFPIQHTWVELQWLGEPGQRAYYLPGPQASSQLELPIGTQLLSLDGGSLVTGHYETQTAWSLVEGRWRRGVDLAQPSPYRYGLEWSSDRRGGVVSSGSPESYLYDLAAVCRGEPGAACTVAPVSIVPGMARTSLLRRGLVAAAGRSLLGYETVRSLSKGLACDSARWIGPDTVACYDSYRHALGLYPAGAPLSDRPGETVPAEGFELPFETCPLTEPRLWFRPGRPSWCAAGRSGWVLGTPLPEAAGTPPTGRPRAAKTELSPWPEGKVARLLRRSFDGRQAVVELVPAGAASEGAAELRLYDLQGERPADRGAIGALGEEQHVLALSAGAEAVALIARDRSGLQALAGGTDWWREHEYWSKAAFSPDGSILAAYGTIADPQLYHAADGRPLRNRSAPLKHLSALIWGPDGHLATLSESEQRLDFFKVRGEELWRTGMVLLEERTDFDFEQRSGFSADGRWFLVAGDLTRRTLVLPVTQGALLGEACRRLPSDLTLEVKRALELDPTARPCGERPAVAD